SDRLLITAAHVVSVSETINVRFPDKEIIPASVVRSYQNADIALVKLLRPRMNAKTVKLGNSNNLQIGQQIFVVGAPFGLFSSLSSGYVSGFRRSALGDNPFTTSEYIQTDASINQGNSGGPMFNLNVEVVGIVSHITTQSGGFEGIGYATSSNLAKRLLLDNEIPWFGADIHPLTIKQAKLLNVPQSTGFLIQRVASSSVFGKMGVQGGDTKVDLEDEELLIGGDIILSIGGIKIEATQSSLDRLAEFASKVNNNPNFEMQVLRGGKVIILKN
ncbi:MAG: trypsin-like peptidase domain-containing protein, partial [Bacteroidota bacterium]